MTKHLILTFLVCFIFQLMAESQSTSDMKRPKILGISHAAFFVKNLDQARSFYKDFLGFAEPYSLKKNNSDSLALTYFKINDHQLIEIFPERVKGSDRLYHFAIETDDAEAMRKYLGSKGIKVPEKTPTGRSGNLNYFVTGPGGVICEIVQYTPTGWTAKNYGKDLPDTRISKQMSHVGIMVANLDSAIRFYGDILGFTETWRGSSNGTILSWVNMKVPDGDDYVEFMLYDKKPSPDRMGTMNHICLVVDDMAVSSKILQSRKLPEGCKPLTEMKTGINRKRQINCYDGDGTRVEIMEPKTVDGLLVPSSTAPAPKFTK